MNKELVRRLILYFVSQLQDMEADITTTRLVKFLYLVDYEHYCRYRSQLTDITWVKYDFGPYFFELPEVIRSTRLDLEEKEFISRRGEGRTYRVSEEFRIDDLVGFSSESLINRILNTWADIDTTYLLDYVYTSTEPMQGATYGNRLDFTKIDCSFDRHRPTKQIKLNKEQSDEIQNLIQKRGKGISEPQLHKFSFDDYYLNAIRNMGQEEHDSGNIKGRINISPEAAEEITIKTN